VIQTSCSPKLTIAHTDILPVSGGTVFWAPLGYLQSLSRSCYQHSLSACDATKQRSPACPKLNFSSLVGEVVHDYEWEWMEDGAEFESAARIKEWAEESLRQRAVDYGEDLVHAAQLSQNTADDGKPGSFRYLKNRMGCPVSAESKLSLSQVWMVNLVNKYATSQHGTVGLLGCGYTSLA
jgi:hypothetical protein